MSKSKTKVQLNIPDYGSMSQSQNRGMVIDKLIQIEERIDIKITKFFNPIEKSRFERVILNSSVMSLGAKLKVLKNMGVSNKVIENIHRMLAIRNGFAHASIIDEVSINYNTEDNKIQAEEKTVLEVMLGNGTIKRKIALLWLEDFFKYEKEIQEFLNEPT